MVSRTSVLLGVVMLVLLGSAAAGGTFEPRALPTLGYNLRVSGVAATGSAQLGNATIQLLKSWAQGNSATW